MNVDVLKEQIKEAEMIVIGIGAELGAKKILPYNHQDIINYFESSGRRLYNQLIEEAKKDPEAEYLLELYYAYYLLNHQGCLNSPYSVLAELLKDKNYFIITSNADDFIYTAPFSFERITAPCGTYRYFQCSTGCNQALYPAMELLEAKIEEYETTGERSRIACGKCKAPLEFNIRTKETAPYYIEQAYLPTWNAYTKWLQNTLNKKLFVLELGEGFEQPSLFHWPFERIVYFNEKARFLRVHEKLAQVGKELKGKAESIPESSLKFLKKLENFW